MYKFCEQERGLALSLAKAMEHRLSMDWKSAYSREQPEKDEDPISSTLAGILMEVRLVQLENTLFLILLTAPPIVTDFRFVHLEKALEVILVTEYDTPSTSIASGMMAVSILSRSMVFPTIASFVIVLQ
jgi:hypothetical protein